MTQALDQVEEALAALEHYVSDSWDFDSAANQVMQEFSLSNRQLKQLRDQYYEGLKTVRGLCRQHRTKVYYDDGNGLIGVYNHKNTIIWYRLTVAGYSQTGSTLTPEGAELRKL